MSVLYVTQPGAEVRKRKGRLHVEWHGNVLAAVPLRDVERVVLLGPAQVTAAAARVLLAGGIPTIFCDTHGRYYGTLAAGHEDTPVLLAQVRAQGDAAYRLATARAIVAAKIHHSRALLQRYARNHPDAGLADCVARLAQIATQAQAASSVAEVMGYEGHAAALYFPAFSRCLLDESLRFTARTRRPPRDGANALLSLGYMLLLPEVVGALAAHGLHLGLGFLHEASPRRPALPLDVLEAFRQPVVDRLTLSVLNRRVFTAASFEAQPDGGVRLAADALKRYLLFFERTMTAPFRHPETGEPTSFRALVQADARALSQALLASRVWSPVTLEL